MTKTLFYFSAIFCFFNFSVYAANNVMKSSMSESEYDAYMKGCREAFRHARPDMSADDVEMMCDDPYLTGSPNESKENKERRLKLLKASDNDKAKHLEAVMTKPATTKEPVPYDMSQSMSSKEYAEYLKNCKQMMKNSSIKDPQDINMMCKNPYLYESPNESHEEKARRLRLIKASDNAKKEVMGNVITPKVQKPKTTNTGSSQ